jgi:hypothetical protein
LCFDFFFYNRRNITNLGDKANVKRLTGQKKYIKDQALKNLQPTDKKTISTATTSINQGVKFKKITEK